MFNMEEPASCASCEGRGGVPRHLLTFLSSMFQSALLFPMWESCVPSGAGVLVLKQNTGGNQQMLGN